MNHKRLLPQLIGLTLIALLLNGCDAAPPTPAALPAATATPTSFSPTAIPALPPTSIPTTTPREENRADGLSEEEAATLGSLEQVDDYPLYTMHYYGAYNQGASSTERARWSVSTNVSAVSPAWACSLFAALGDADHMLYGRNFDWEYSPALLLFIDPPDGYASVSMVDIAYLGFGGARAGTPPDLPLAQRRSLLNAPFWPFDGMNEHGLTVGMAAVPGSEMPYSEDKETLDSLGVIREMLDRARDVDEAIAILESHNISWSGGPPLHYLIADPSGRAMLVEFYEGEMVSIPNETAWHVATNHLRTTADETGPSGCWRYDEIHRRLTETEGWLTTPEAMTLLAGVAQEATQWSVVYGMTSGQVYVVMGQEYEEVHTFCLGPH
jgi:hypothetical protein